MHSIAAGVIDKMVLAIDDGGRLTSLGGLGIRDEFACFVHAGHFEEEENIVWLLDTTPEMNQAKAGALMRSLM
jgi:hypothetical protein